MPGTLGELLEAALFSETPKSSRSIFKDELIPCPLDQLVYRLKRLSSQVKLFHSLGRADEVISVVNRQSLSYDYHGFDVLILTRSGRRLP
jgi:hypothetical protein